MVRVQETKREIARIKNRGQVGNSSPKVHFAIDLHCFGAVLQLFYVVVLLFWDCFATDLGLC